MRKTTKSENLQWWQLSLIGVGCIIGTGYFLGSSIAIQKADNAILIAYAIAGLGTWFVFQALAKLTAHHPVKGSFRTYAKHAFGDWAGFSNGWVYWSSEMLIMGSQLTALSIFAQYWFPNTPLWIFATIFAIAGLSIILMGVHKVEQLENVFGIMKVAAIAMFLIISIAVISGLINPLERATPSSSPLTDLFPQSGIGLWTALLYAFYAFGGIEIMGLMAEHLKNPKDAQKSGNIMLLVLTSLYLLSFYFVLKLTSSSAITPDESPFLTVLISYKLPVFVPHIFNSILIIAGFSTMVASLYAVTTMLLTLAEEGDAPKLFAQSEKEKVPLPAFILTCIVVAISIIIALLVPGKIFEYFTTAAGLMLLYNWMFILLSFRKLMDQSLKSTIGIWVAFTLIAFAITGTLFDKVSRPGFFVSIGFIVLIALATVIKLKRKH
ncbi:amino acid permease [Alkalihalobacillus sp. CinArs1]|uniref:amino acid permease n=1 Tax=Alkalihalobacillus sp. CinArs1 TaxID=2995314 RepID=UPI0022DD8C56|nr:amino acid permease [Alkalihalobacillus sp. CinArs1]